MPDSIIEAFEDHLEARIRAERDCLVSAAERGELDVARAALDRMVCLIKQRSPEQVAAMERRMGIA